MERKQYDCTNSLVLHTYGKEKGKNGLTSRFKGPLGAALGGPKLKRYTINLIPDEINCGELTKFVGKRLQFFLQSG